MTDDIAGISVGMTGRYTLPHQTSNFSKNTAFVAGGFSLSNGICADDFSALLLLTE
jgi:hypothetical protein